MNRLEIYSKAQKFGRKIYKYFRRKMKIVLTKV